MRVKFGIVLMLGLAFASAVSAQPRGGGPGRDGPGGPAFEDAEDGDEEDSDEDRPRRPRQQLFISPSGQPFRAPMGAPYPVAAWFTQADANHDGRLTREELRADAAAYFKVLDADSDGQLSMPEATRWESEIAPEIGQPTIGAFREGRGRALKRNQLDTAAQGAAAYSLINEPHPVRGADADFSMKVSRDEWRAAADRRFAVLDFDSDGAVAVTDLKPTLAQQFAERQERAREKAERKGARRPPPR